MLMYHFCLHTCHYDIDDMEEVMKKITGAKFEIICSHRRTGRTSQLIEKCSGYNYALIVCPTRDMAYHVFKLAQNMGKKIPMPITFFEFVEKKFYGKNIDAFLIDDLDCCLEMAAKNVPIDTVVIEKKRRECGKNE